MARKRRGDKQTYDTLYDAIVGRSHGNNNQTNNRQQTLELMYRRVLGELAMNRFEWKGFEDTGVNVRYLEMMLYQTALCVVFKDTNVRDKRGDLKSVGTDQIFAVRGSASGSRNLVDDPTAFTISGPSFQGRVLTNAQCVPVWANYFRVPDLDIVNIYAWQLADEHRSIEINTHNARRTRMLAYNENSSLTAKNINDMIDRGEQTIPVNAQMGDMVTALDLGIDPKVLEVLPMIKSRTWNEAMGMLGINNANHEKKERVQSAEVEANDDQIVSARRVNLNARQDAARLINKMYPELNVSVDYYSNAPVETVNPLTGEQTVGGV